MTMLPHWLDGEKTQNEGILEMHESHDQKLCKLLQTSESNITKKYKHCAQLPTYNHNTYSQPIL